MGSYLFIWLPTARGALEVKGSSLTVVKSFFNELSLFDYLAGLLVLVHWLSC